MPNSLHLQFCASSQAVPLLTRCGCAARKSRIVDSEGFMTSKRRLRADLKSIEPPMALGLQLSCVLTSSILKRSTFQAFMTEKVGSLHLGNGLPLLLAGVKVIPGQ